MSTQRPVRTCIGCRQRAAAAELLRIVVMPDATNAAVTQTARTADETPHDGPDAHGSALVVPDPRRRLPGRGAWLHPTPDCVDLAQRRRAFGRALRASVPIDLTPVREYVSVSRPGETTSGTPQEMKS